MNRVLRNIVERLVRSGSLTITDPAGKTHRFGDGTGKPCHIAIRSRRAETAITLDPMLAVPEAYMDGDLDFLEGEVIDLLRIVYQNMGEGGRQVIWLKAMEGLRFAFRRLQQFNPQGRARRNVRHHYDLSGELYRLFLDRDMQYSCAYFPRLDMTLEEAQEAKKRHIMAKLRLADGQCVLDIGSGWGGLGLSIARAFDVDFLGITLSREQHAVSTRRAVEEGLEQRVHFEIRDYRELQQRFDRIVSVGMFEHVGINHYGTFFRKCASLLKPDGVMLLHTIGRSGRPSVTNAFIRKYIFPGGYIPALSEIAPAIERSGLIVTDVEVWRLHYAETLRQWRERFLSNRDKARALYDERFCRMWEFYLSGAEASFRWQDMVVFQFQIARRNDTLPMTRDYMMEEERKFAAAEAMPGPKHERRKSHRKTADRTPAAE
jgi:cyclopropane-fatty-acyl-phospholipid synthase